MMMKINLLPHREARRAADLRETVAVLLLGLIVICGGVFFVDKGVKSDLAMAEANVTQLQADIDRYKPQQKLVESFKKQKKQLQNKLDIIGSLETKGKGIKLEGQSLDTGVVADFLRGLNSSPYFTNVDLDKTAGGKIVDGIRLVSFEIRADMQTPVAKADDAKS
jgi:Tfp pilus assembly protein PilN